MTGPISPLRLTPGRKDPPRDGHELGPGGHGRSPRAGKYECLSCPGGPATIGRLIAAHLKGIPASSVDLPHSAELLMEWFRDPRGYVLTPAFFEQQRPVLSGFLTGEETDPQALKAACVNPELTKYGDNWKLRFQAMNRRGGVELWLAQGRRVDPFTIESIDIRTVKRDGTFCYPNEL